MQYFPGFRTPRCIAAYAGRWAVANESQTGAARSVLLVGHAAHFLLRQRAVPLLIQVADYTSKQYATDGRINAKAGVADVGQRHSNGSIRMVDGATGEHLGEWERGLHNPEP